LISFENNFNGNLLKFRVRRDGSSWRKENSTENISRGKHSGEEKEGKN